MIIIENCDVDAGNESYHADGDDLIRSIILMSKFLDALASLAFKLSVSE